MSALWDGTEPRCPGQWLQPGYMFQCAQNAGHDGPHAYRDWEWTNAVDKRNPWSNGRRRKAEM